MKKPTRYALNGARLSRPESRMVARGVAAGFQAGRHGSEQPCPYVEQGRPRSLWLAGYRMGHEDGRAELEKVRESYREGLEALDGPQRNCWGCDMGQEFTSTTR